MDIAKDATLHPPNSGSEQAQCIVSNCSQTGVHLWIRPDWQGWPAEWLVCADHYSKLLADREWQRVHGLAALLEAVAPHA